MFSFIAGMMVGFEFAQTDEGYFFVCDLFIVRIVIPLTDS